MNEKLNAIAQKASADFLSLVKESEAKILEAWDSCAEEAQLSETAPKFKLGFSVTLDLDADKMETALSFGIKHKLSVASAIPDPHQGELLVGTTVKFASGKEVVVANAQEAADVILKDAARKFGKG